MLFEVTVQFPNSWLVLRGMAEENAKWMSHGKYPNGSIICHADDVGESRVRDVYKILRGHPESIIMI
jgi:hypothetical protein